MKGPKGLITCENNVGDMKQTGSSIRFLIDSEGLGDTPNKQKCILCVQMHCLPSCEYRIDCKLEFRKNKAEKRMLIIKMYTD